MGIYNCAPISNPEVAEYQFYEMTGAGDSEDNVDTFRSDSTPFPSGVRTSIEVNTTADCHRGWAHKLKLSTFCPSNSILEVYLTSDELLTSEDVWAECSYRDLTDPAPNHVSTRGTDTVGPGLALTQDLNSGWLGGKTYNYVLSLDTALNPGVDMPVDVQIFTAKASIKVFYDTTIGIK